MKHQNTNAPISVVLLLATLLICLPAAVHSGRVLQRQAHRLADAAHTPQSTMQHEMNGTTAPFASNMSSHMASGTGHIRSHSRVLVADTDCSSALTPGGPKSTMDKAIGIGLTVASAIPGPIGAVAKGLTSIISFISDKSVSGRSIYNCISGYVEAAIDSKLDAAELKGINNWIDIIKGDIGDFQNWTADAPAVIDKEYQDGIQHAFQLTVDDTGKLGRFFTGAEGPRSPGGLLTTFTTFTTTQHLPVLKMRYDNANDIYGSSSPDTLKQYVRESRNALNDAISFYNRASLLFNTSRLGKVTSIKTEELLYKDKYSFTDGATGQVLT